MQIYLTTQGEDVYITDQGNLYYPHPTVDAPLILPLGSLTVTEALDSLSLQQLVDDNKIVLHDGTNHPIGDLNTVSPIEWPTLTPNEVITNALAVKDDGTLVNCHVAPDECYAETNNKEDNGINYNNTSAKAVQFTGDNFTNTTCFSWDAATNSWIASTSGRLVAGANLFFYSRGYRVHVTARVVRVRNGSVLSKRLGSTYMRNANWTDRDNINGYQYFDFQPKDRFYIDVFRDGQYTTATYINDYSNFSLRLIG